MKRLFAAIKVEPAPGFIQVLSQISTSLRHERIKWVEPENMHLTLRFFGETDEERIPGIKAALKLAAAESTGFNMKINRTGIFGSRYDPRVIWFGLDKNPLLDLLASNTVKELSKAGWEADRQNFVPHLTIGRIKELNDKALFQSIIDKFKEAGIQDQYVNHISLYESILKPQGPVYINLQKFQLSV
jgi:RNA 2',3'-cyclic 3'-phosphodiesterase